MDLPAPLNHVFVDYENVQALDLGAIGKRGVTFTLLVGPHKKKLDVELVEQLFAHAASVELVRLTASGRNALDFTLAYYIGRAVAADPAGHFHIVSKDTGYDPMIKHLRSRHIWVQRHNDFSELTLSELPKLKSTVTNEAMRPTPPVIPVKAPAAKEPVTRVLEHLRKQVKNRPKTRKRLVSHLTSVVGKEATDSGIEKLIEELVKAGHIVIDEAKETVSYTLTATKQS